MFILLARKAKTISRKTILTGWLYRTTHFVAADALKAQRRRQWREHQAARMQTDFENVASDDVNSAWEQIAPYLDEAMAKLGGRDRDAVLLRFFENKSFAQVGAALGVNEDAARKRIVRALEKLRRHFYKRGVMLTATLIAGAVSTHSVHAAPVISAKTISVVALTKGAAAGGSTLALVKGALKLMAWTKAKTAIVAGVVVLLAAGTTTVTVKEIKSSRANAIFERIWAQPDSQSMVALIHAPPALIVRATRYPANQSQGYWTDARIGHGVWVNASVSNLVEFAYHFPPWRIVFPANMPSGGFDLMETLPAGQNEAELKKEIQKRFGLMGHTETREGDALRLTVNDPARLNSHISAGGRPGAYGVGAADRTMNYVFKNQTLKDVASQLEGYFDQSVVEPNGLTGHYDFTFRVNFKLQPEALQQSFRDQLAQFGLTLNPGRAPVEMLIVKKAP